MKQLLMIKSPSVASLKVLRCFLLATAALFRQARLRATNFTVYTTCTIPGLMQPQSFMWLRPGNLSSTVYAVRTGIGCNISIARQ